MPQVGIIKIPLKGSLGDALHAVLRSAGYNLRWLLRAIARKAPTGISCASRIPEFDSYGRNSMISLSTSSKRAPTTG
jgi:hypothetical protein